MASLPLSPRARLHRQMCSLQSRLRQKQSRRQINQSLRATRIDRALGPNRSQVKRSRSNRLSLSKLHRLPRAPRRLLVRNPHSLRKRSQTCLHQSKKELRRLRNPPKRRNLLKKPSSRLSNLLWPLQIKRMRKLSLRQSRWSQKSLIELSADNLTCLRMHCTRTSKTSKKSMKVCWRSSAIC